MRGAPTAPAHFLGDYPNNKWRQFASAISDDLRGSGRVPLALDLLHEHVVKEGTEAMLRGAGFEIVDRPQEEIYICRRGREVSRG